MSDPKANESFGFEVEGEEKGEKTEESSSATEILKRIKECFGEGVGEAFEEQEINDNDSIADLASRDADAPIFTKLGLSYGKAVRFKKEFKVKQLKHNAAKQCSPAPKPSMADMSTFSPEIRRLYLAKRKQVGVLACEHWDNQYPKFNTPERKSELAKFAETIAKTCAVPAVGFNKDGIEKHIKDFFSEQRRYKKRKLNENALNSSNSSTEENVNSDPDLPKFGKRRSSPSVLEEGVGSTETKDTENVKHRGSPSVLAKSAETKDTDNDNSEISSNASTLSVESENEEIVCEDPPPSNTSAGDVNLPPKLCQRIVKSVCGRILTREEIINLLKNKFSVTARNLTSLTPSQLLEVVSKKLIRNRYVELPDSVDHSKLQMSAIKVKKEIEM